MISPFGDRSLRSSLRQTRGALRSLNTALQSPALSLSERRVLEAVRLVHRESEAALVGLLSDAQAERQRRAA